ATALQPSSSSAEIDTLSSAARTDAVASSPLASAPAPSPGTAVTVATPSPRPPLPEAMWLASAGVPTRSSSPPLSETAAEEEAAASLSAACFSVTAGAGASSPALFSDPPSGRSTPAPSPALSATTL
ncbi:unnamed protein product, partial [Ectocarpus sp. 12 AP-2014]